ncbi:MAG: hypothetical protein V3W04_06615 [Gammaproteobacteria bacterium]
MNNPLLNNIEVTFHQLMESPHLFSFQDFEFLTNHFQEKLTIDDHFILIEKRLRYGQYDDEIERKTLLAIIEGNNDKANRLLNLLERRNSLNLKAVN